MESLALAYETYGTLNRDKSNAILINHPLTCDQFVASEHPITGKAGWWSQAVGPGKAIDTDRYFVICANVPGGCMGSVGPRSLDPTTGKPYGLSFPVVTIGDMVRAHALLVESLAIDRLHAVVGASMGGMLTLDWAVRYKEKVGAAVVIASSSRHPAQNIAFHEVGRQAVMADSDWNHGRYLDAGVKPLKGLSVARMGALVTYLSEQSLHDKFARRLHAGQQTYSFDADFQVESYLRHQGRRFVDRFDANSYLYLTRAMDYFDLESNEASGLSACFTRTPVRFCLMSFTSDWLFPTSESKRIVRALSAADADVSFVEIDADFGHDSFLLDAPDFFDALRGFIEGLST